MAPSVHIYVEVDTFGNVARLRRSFICFCLFVSLVFCLFVSLLLLFSRLTFFGAVLSGGAVRSLLVLDFVHVVDGA